MKLLLAFLLLQSIAFGQTVTNGTGTVTIINNGTLIYWALITGGSSATTPCTSDPCTILRQGPVNWLSSVNRVSAGLYQLNYLGTPFANMPSASISCEGVNSGEIGQIRYGLSSSSELTVQTVDPTSLSRGDGSFSVLVPAN
jgi:hypothetical protein